MFSRFVLVYAPAFRRAPVEFGGFEARDYMFWIPWHLSSPCFRHWFVFKGIRGHS